MIAEAWNDDSRRQSLLRCAAELAMQWLSAARSEPTCAPGEREEIALALVNAWRKEIREVPLASLSRLSEEMQRVARAQADLVLRWLAARAEPKLRLQRWQFQPEKDSPGLFVQCDGIDQREIVMRLLGYTPRTLADAARELGEFPDPHFSDLPSRDVVMTRTEWNRIADHARRSESLRQRIIAESADRA